MQNGFANLKPFCFSVVQPKNEYEFIIKLLIMGDLKQINSALKKILETSEAEKDKLEKTKTSTEKASASKISLKNIKRRFFNDKSNK